jgi:protein tyrosine/serine phosphatase
LLLVAAGMYFLVAAPFNTLIARLRREPALPVERYGVVWENRLTRSGTPEDESGWKWLRSQGVKSVVTFRKKKVAYNEYGFEHVLQIPISENSPVASITDEQADEFLRFVRDPSHAPVHIHCKKGRNRTGMMTALVRYAIDGWSMEKALEEAKRYHYNTDLPEDRIAWLRSWASRNEPGSYRLEPDGKRV